MTFKSVKKSNVLANNKSESGLNKGLNAYFSPTEKTLLQPPRHLLKVYSLTILFNMFWEQIQNSITRDNLPNQVVQLYIFFGVSELGDNCIAGNKLAKSGGPTLYIWMQIIFNVACIKHLRKTDPGKQICWIINKLII